MDENGENVGIVTIAEAQQRADAAGLDLVEIAPNADPPVCKIINYSKFLYEKEKKEREARKAQTKIEIKEIRLRPKTEITYPELALEDLREIAEELSDVADIEQAPNLEGRSMSMMLTPKKDRGGSSQAQPAKEAAPAAK